jgi:hypothetical protein
VAFLHAEFLTPFDDGACRCLAKAAASRRSKVSWRIIDPG